MRAKNGWGSPGHAQLDARLVAKFAELQTELERRKEVASGRPTPARQLETARQLHHTTSPPPPLHPTSTSHLDASAIPHAAGSPYGADAGALYELASLRQRLAMAERAALDSRRAAEVGNLTTLAVTDGAHEIIAQAHHTAAAKIEQVGSLFEAQLARLQHSALTAVNSAAKSPVPQTQTVSSMDSRLLLDRLSQLEAKLDASPRLTPPPNNTEQTATPADVNTSAEVVALERRLSELELANERRTRQLQESALNLRHGLHHKTEQVSHFRQEIDHIVTALESLRRTRQTSS